VGEDEKRGNLEKERHDVGNDLTLVHGALGFSGHGFLPPQHLFMSSSSSSPSWSVFSNMSAQQKKQQIFVRRPLPFSQEQNFGAFDVPPSSPSLFSSFLLLHIETAERGDGARLGSDGGEKEEGKGEVRVMEIGRGRALPMWEEFIDRRIARCRRSTR
tara:strand:+ start:398 stop:871 length:474 start_codon:yes stop_codon:yes gene_type:complete